ncbi:hypothetical protein DH2020_030126 [Rehmannia glutinosa]|uniref:pyruvate kinase n=1 Tax=Rehmannia glutinosa TaxID=99300 RepID=A0ABR0VLV2_REHGL
MASNHLLLEEPIRMASILEPSKPLMLDTVGPELQVVNKTEQPISLEEDSEVILTPDQDKEATSHLLPINFTGLSKAVKTGDTIFIGQYLFTGSETTSVWLEVIEVKEKDVVCMIKNSATLAGPLYTLHVSQIRIELPTLTEKDKEVCVSNISRLTDDGMTNEAIVEIIEGQSFRVISTWGARNNIDFLSLSYTRHAQDIRHAREFLSKLGDLSQTQIFAKIENVEGLIHFDEILQEADGIILSRGNLGIDLPPEKVFLFQKEAVHKCNMAGKPAVVTRVVDSMTDNLRPTRAEATDVANAAEKVYNQDLYFKKTVKYVGEPMSHLESIASSAVRAAIKVKASVIICFTSSGRAARLIAKYRPTMPVISVVIPRLKSNQLHWTFSGAFVARQSLIVRGLFPMLADPRHPADSTSATNESVLKVALDHGKASGVIKPHDRVVVCQKVGDASVVKIIELED